MALRPSSLDMPVYIIIWSHALSHFVLMTDDLTFWTGIDPLKVGAQIHIFLSNTHLSQYSLLINLLQLKLNGVDLFFVRSPMHSLWVSWRWLGKAWWVWIILYSTFTSHSALFTGYCFCLCTSYFTLLSGLLSFSLWHLLLTHICVISEFWSTNFISYDSVIYLVAPSQYIFLCLQSFRAYEGPISSDPHAPHFHMPAMDVFCIIKVFDCLCGNKKTRANWIRAHCGFLCLKN